jgi:hypothetical protein
MKNKKNRRWRSGDTIEELRRTERIADFSADAIG